MFVSRSPGKRLADVMKLSQIGNGCGIMSLNFWAKLGQNQAIKRRKKTGNAT